MNICPECGGKATSSCRCPRKHSECANGHRWHTCMVHKCIVPRAIPHDIPLTQCTCATHDMYVFPMHHHLEEDDFRKLLLSFLEASADKALSESTELSILWEYAKGERDKLAVLTHDMT